MFYGGQIGEAGSLEELMEVKKSFFVVAVYETNQSYGGPEEGGWWYPTGEPSTDPDLVMKTKIFTDQNEAMKYRDELREFLKHENTLQERKPPGSVLCQGWLDTFITENEYPSAYPKQRPHYE